MLWVRVLFVVLPFVLTGGALVAYSLVIILFAFYRLHALVAFASLLAVGVLLLCLGPFAGLALYRSEARG